MYQNQNQQPRKMAFAGLLLGGGSFSSSPPFHICSLTSSALSWERTECLSRGGGMGSRQSQETQLWGWLAARSMASSPLLHRAAESRACHPLGTNKQETAPILHLLPGLGPPGFTLAPDLPASPCLQNLKTKDINLRSTNKIKLRDLGSCGVCVWGGGGH